MLTEMVVYGHKIEEEVKAMQSEIKKNIQWTNSEEKETRTQINGLEQKEEINIQPEKNEETGIQKNEEGLRNLQDIFKLQHLNHRVTRRRRGIARNWKLIWTNNEVELH